MSDSSRTIPEGATTATEVARRLAMREGEVAVLGLGKSGEAASRLLRSAGMSVYASDSGTGDVIRANGERLARTGVSVQVGGHDLARITRASFVVASPGIPPAAPPIAAAHAAGVPVVSEVEIALRLAPGVRTIAVTGTNGKTTTTALIGHLLRALGKRAVDAGNIGTPVSDAVLQEALPEWFALEMSSFQLHDTPGLVPTVGVLTTLSPDHLDRYASITEYYGDKRRLFANAGVMSRWVVNADNTHVMEMVQGVAGTVYTFSTTSDSAHATFDRTNDMLRVLGHDVVPRSALTLAGDHNVANALAALLAVMVAHESHTTKESLARLAGAIGTFHALPHRLEPVHESHGVLWLNDSKATNVSSTAVAIAGMTRPTVLLLGGRHKGEPYFALADEARRIARAIIAYGEATPEIVADLETPLQGKVPLHAMPDATFEEVMAKAQTLALPGDIVLLSPACSSYDMFNNYEERGREFARLARRHG